MAHCEWLDAANNPSGAGVVYPLEEARAKYEVQEICDNTWAWLVLNWAPDRLLLKFAVLELYEAFLDGEKKEVTLTTLVFYGEGPVGNLRECRHTWWGDDDGYLSFPSGRVIMAAFEALAEYYDEMR